jgi:hypothetical protein
MVFKASWVGPQGLKPPFSLTGTYGAAESRALSKLDRELSFSAVGEAVPFPNHF